MFRSLAVLLVVLSLVAGPDSLLPIAVECSRCADHCPMKKPRLPCHDQDGSAHHPCHSGARFAIASCAHGSVVAPPSREFALLVPPSALVATDFAVPLVAIASRSTEAPLLEPPVDPPRSWFAV